MNRCTEKTEISAERLHSAIGYLTPLHMWDGCQKAIHEESDRKLEEARRTQVDHRRQKKSSTPRKASRQAPDTDVSSSASQEDRDLPGSYPSVCEMPATGSLNPTVPGSTRHNGCLRAATPASVRSKPANTFGKTC
ncbi:MAG UNVERIFIED_CONTAM: hypothetical protein LVR18_17605 [Planctomycetaceae bacterium]